MIFYPKILIDRKMPQIEVVPCRECVLTDWFIDLENQQNMSIDGGHPNSCIQLYRLQ